LFRGILFYLCCLVANANANTAATLSITIRISPLAVVVVVENIAAGEVAAGDTASGAVSTVVTVATLNTEKSIA